MGPYRPWQVFVAWLLALCLLAMAPPACADQTDRPLAPTDWQLHQHQVFRGLKATLHAQLFSTYQLAHWPWHQLPGVTQDLPVSSSESASCTHSFQLPAASAD